MGAIAVEFVMITLQRNSHKHPDSQTLQLTNGTTHSFSFRYISISKFYNPYESVLELYIDKLSYSEVGIEMTID